MWQIGVHAVISIIIYLVCITLAFQAVKNLRIEKIMKTDNVFAAQIFLLFCAIALGFLVGQFVIAFIDASMSLSNFF